MTAHSRMWKAEEYDGIDVGVRFAVKVLHAAGIETCQSCQGGKGHAYAEPSIDMPAGPRDAAGFAALAALQSYGLPVSSVLLVWDVHNGLPYDGPLWRVTFFKTMEDRAEEWPVFEWSYQSVERP